MNPVPTNHSLGAAIKTLRSRWWMFVALGALMLVFGMYAFANLYLATVASVFWVGAMMLVAGLAMAGHAFAVRSWGRFFYWLSSGLLYAAAGVFAFINTGLATAVLTFLLAVALTASGALRAWIGFSHRGERGWGWVAVGGVITLLAGVVIAIGWPVNSIWVLGLFLAADLIFQGWSLLALGFALKR